MKNVSQMLEMLNEWPESWAASKKDVGQGQEIIEIFKAFIASLIDTGLSASTIRRHIDNLWLLGGEIIRDINHDASKRKETALRLMASVVGEDGGPYCRHLDSEEEMRAFDSTCRKLYKFIKAY